MKKSSSDKNNKNKNIYKRVLYYFDIWLSKGTLPTIILLIALFVIFKPFEVAAAPLFILGWCMLLYGVAECLSGIKAHKAERQKRIQEEAAANTSDTSSQVEQIEEAEAEEVVSEETTPSTPPQQP